MKSDFAPFMSALIKHKKRIILALVGILLTFQFALQIHLASSDSQTTDEAVHIAAGYTYLTKHDFRFNPEHPPLIKALAAIPLLFLPIKEPQNTSLWDNSASFLYDSWQENRSYGTALLYTSGNNADLLLFWARFPITILTLLLGLSIFLISRRFFGDTGGLISTLLYVFNPTVTAHGHLVTTDIGVALTYTLALYFLYHAVTKPNAKTWAIFGVFFGIAQITKFTAIILIPLVAITMIWWVWQNKSRFKKPVMFGWIILAIVTTWLVIWAGYGFNHTAAPKQSSVTLAIAQQNPIPHVNPYQLQQPFADKLYTLLRPVIIPRDYVKGMAMVIGHVESGHDSYLLGHYSKTGWWYYFPVVFITKTPLPSLIIFGLACYLLIKTRKKHLGAIYVLAGGALFFAFAMTSKANLGVRHVLPFFPAVMIASGFIGTIKARWQSLVTALIIIQMAEFVMISPFHLSYFNQLVLGSYNGYHIASDSNLDWGQDLKRIQQYVSTSCNTPPFILYTWNGEEALNYYGIPHQSPDNITPGATGTLIASTSNLTEPRNAWIKKLTPVKRLTPSVFVYELTGKEQ